MLKFWFVLLILVGGTALWLFGKASYQLISYALLNERTPAHIEQLEIEQVGSSRFAIAASFTYEVEGKSYFGKTVFSHAYYLNYPTAEKALKNWKEKNWETWYSSYTHSYSSLQKIFPFKSCIHALLGIGVLVYFYFLRGYLQRIETQNS
jgi:hypothetical protein